MNMKHYDNLKAVPPEALKPIGFGKLKGKSDINPQWRYEAMTNEFGMCGIGWKYEITKTWTQPLIDGQLLLFVEINLYVKDGEVWGSGIPAIGGDFVIEKDKNGIHGNDEAYKMATTDALGVAMKMLGVAADVYRGLANDSKYGREPVQAVQQVQYQQPQQSVYGFPANELEITTAWNNAGWDPNGVAGYIHQRYNRPPAQLSTEECYALMIEFQSYAQQKLGGQQ
jgi:hypothetical protein